MLSVNKASAGSGKTYTLAREYIKLLLGRRSAETGRYTLERSAAGRHRNILAVTFTNKATEEMKCRIIHELAKLAGMEKEWVGRKVEYENYLIQEFGCSKGDLREAARKALVALLIEFNRFQISTIDSFFQSVLRTFAREAELSGNYEVELNRKDVLKLAVGELLLTLRSDPDSAATRTLSAWLTDLMTNLLSDGKSFDIFNRSNSVFEQLVNFLDDISDETFLSRQSEILGYLNDPTHMRDFAKAVTQREKDLWDAARNGCRKAVDLVESLGLENQLAAHVLPGFNKWLGPDVAKLESGKTIAKVADDPLEAFKSKFRESAPAGAVATFQTAAQAIMDLVSEVQMLRAIRGNLYMLGLLSRTSEFMKETLNERNTLLLSDTNAILTEIIGDDSAPFVYERIGTTINHFLIDEFQDTSRMQWHNMLPLLNESLGAGHDSLIIGDEKQCIYRFRNSDPELLQSQVFTDLGDFIDNAAQGVKNCNYRSAAEIVNFNNRLFDAIATGLDYDDIYANVCQEVGPGGKNLPGYVSVTYFKKPDDKDESVAEDDEEALSTQQQTLANMMTHIRRQLAAGYREKDIAVLVRKRKQTEEVIDLLLREKFRVVSDDSMSVDSSPAVRLIVSVMRNRALSSVKNVSIKKDAADMARLYFNFEHQLNSGVSRSDALLEAIAVREREIKLEQKRMADDPEGALAQQPAALPAPEIQCTNLSSIVEEIISEEITSPEILRSENIFLSAFRDLVVDFERRMGSDIREFIRWWDSSGHSTNVTMPSDDKAIRVMTIHKSKGLEFPCVHIPFASWKTFDPKSPEWFDFSGLPGFPADIVPPCFPLTPASWMDGVAALRDQYNDMMRKSILDELNAAYVGFTRAGRELIVGMSDIHNAGDTQLSKIIAAALGIHPGETLTFGEPTSPVAEDIKPRKTLDPSGVPASMPAYCARLRSDLWKNTRMDSKGDDVPEV